MRYTLLLALLLSTLGAFAQVRDTLNIPSGGQLIFFAGEHSITLTAKGQSVKFDQGFTATTKFTLRAQLCSTLAQAVDGAVPWADFVAYTKGQPALLRPYWAQAYETHALVAPLLSDADAVALVRFLDVELTPKPAEQPKQQGKQ